MFLIRSNINPCFYTQDLVNTLASRPILFHPNAVFPKGLLTSRAQTAGSSKSLQERDLKKMSIWIPASSKIRNTCQIESLLISGLTILNRNVSTLNVLLISRDTDKKIHRFIGSLLPPLQNSALSAILHRPL